MTQNVGDIEYVIKADTAQLLRADKQVATVTDNRECGFCIEYNAGVKANKFGYRRFNSGYRQAVGDSQHGVARYRRI